MRNVLLKIQYDGSRFHGSQIQKGERTVQQTVQDALKKLFPGKVTFTGCSRTDAGVHARCYCAKVTFDSDIAASKVPFALNTVLPDDIAVMAAADADDSFHPRYDVKKKTYEYRIFLGKHRDPFKEGRYWHCSYPIDRNRVRDAASHFSGTHDFKGFMSSGSSVADTVRTVYDCSAHFDGDELTISITADGFLYNMVRIIAGTIVDVGKGRIGLEELDGIIASGDRSRAGETAPPYGLYLVSVDYGKDVFSENKG